MCYNYDLAKYNKMDLKKIEKNIGRFLGRQILYACALITKVMPSQWLYCFAKSIAFLGFIFVSKQKKIAVEGLSIAFGKEKTSEEIKKIAKECFSYMAKSAVELLFLLDRPRMLKQRVEIAGKDNLDAALSAGKGVILVSAHFGNFPLMLAKLGLEGYRVSGVMRQMRDSRVEKILFKRRQEYAVKTIYTQPRKECVEATIRTLRNNELIFLLLDQNFGTGGIFVDFFGRKAATATGPVVFAQRTEASLVPCFIIRQKDDTHKIVFEPALRLEKGKTPQETIAINIQKLTVIIEAYVRKYPEEWGWIHRRWKTQIKA